MKISYLIRFYTAEDIRRAPSSDWDIEIDQITVHHVLPEQVFQEKIGVTSKPTSMFHQ